MPRSIDNIVYVWYSIYIERKCITLKINYDTYISIIRNNESISFIPFKGNVSNEELEKELTIEFTDLDIPLDLLDDCMYNGMLSYEDIYVYIVDVNWGDWYESIA